jgi:hypothetical protein
VEQSVASPAKSAPAPQKPKVQNPKADPPAKPEPVKSLAKTMEAGSAPPEYEAVRPADYIYAGVVTADKKTPAPLKFFGPNIDPKGRKLPRKAAQWLQEVSAFDGGYSALSRLYCSVDDVSETGWQKKKCKIGDVVAFMSSAKGVARFTPGVEYPIFINQSFYLPDWDYIQQKWKRVPAGLVALGRIRNGGKRTVFAEMLLPLPYRSSSASMNCNPTAKVEPNEYANLCYMEDAEK